MWRGCFIVVVPASQFRSTNGRVGGPAPLHVRRQLGDELVAVTDGGVDVRGDLRDQRVDPGEDAAELRVRRVRQQDDGFTGGVGERLDVDDLGVQGFEGRGGIERVARWLGCCVPTAVVRLRHGDWR